ncbi:hypothetical protein ACJX0J_019775, partial [Zea mays]
TGQNVIEHHIQRNYNIQINHTKLAYEGHDFMPLVGILYEVVVCKIPHEDPSLLETTALRLATLRINKFLGNLHLRFLAISIYIVLPSGHLSIIDQYIIRSEDFLLWALETLMSMKDSIMGDIIVNLAEEKCQAPFTSCLYSPFIMGNMMDMLGT